jgi:hypothetical protein
MSSQDSSGSTVPAERPTNPTHFGGEGLYEPEADKPRGGEDPSLKVPLSEHLSSTAQESLQSLEAPAKRYNLLTWAAVGGVVWLLIALLRRSTGRT